MSHVNYEEERILEALRDFITGEGVERVRLELTLHDRDLTEAFIGQLERLGFLPTTVADVNVQPGERIPAFLIQDRTAFFGWVFWEKFTEKKMRKLWGSVLRNRKGDWEIQIPPTRPTIIYANTAKRYTMDIDRPT